MSKLMFIVLSGVLFLVVRQFLIQWGLVERNQDSKFNPHRKEINLRRLASWTFYFIFWVMPSLAVWHLTR